MPPPPTPGPDLFRPWDTRSSAPALPVQCPPCTCWPTEEDGTRSRWLLGPIALLAGILWLANRRAARLEAQDAADRADDPEAGADA